MVFSSYFEKYNVHDQHFRDNSTYKVFCTPNRFVSDRPVYAN